MREIEVSGTVTVNRVTDVYHIVRIDGTVVRGSDVDTEALTAEDICEALYIKRFSDAELEEIEMAAGVYETLTQRLSTVGVKEIVAAIGDCHTLNREDLAALSVAIAELID